MIPDNEEARRMNKTFPGMFLNVYDTIIFIEDTYSLKIPYHNSKNKVEIQSSSKALGMALLLSQDIGLEYVLSQDHFVQCEIQVSSDS